jgi:hypothetical protein
VGNVEPERAGDGRQEGPRGECSWGRFAARAGGSARRSAFFGAILVESIGGRRRASKGEWRDEPQPGAAGELDAVEGVGQGSSVANGVECVARRASVCRRPESSGGAILTHGPQARNRSLVKGRFDGPQARLEWHGGEFSMWPSEKGQRLNDLSSARFDRTGETSGCDVPGGQEARAASAAGDGSPRGPGVLAGGSFPLEPSSAGSDRIDICRAGEGTVGHLLFRALPRRRCQKSSGSGAILGRSVQIGTFRNTELVKSNYQHEPVPRQVHPRPPLNRTGIFPTPWACAAGTRAKRAEPSVTKPLLGGPSRDVRHAKC